MFWLNEEYATGLADIVLDGVVCVVDAVFGQKQMEEDHSTDDLHVGESIRQIAGSDVILLNKSDLVEPQVLEDTKALIRSINAAAPIYRTVKGEIDLKHIIGISAYQRPPPDFSAASSTRSADTHVHTENCDHSHDAPAPTHYEVRGISSLQVTCPPLDQPHLDKLDEWIRNALWENRVEPAGGDSTTTPLEVQILRCKGAFTSAKGVHYVLQGVRNMYEISELPAAESESLGVPDTGKVVLIGKGLTEGVRRSLEGVLA
ncbi:hypothetical protein CVT26_014126 [Gymnopilus dilepis]|uniref:CobW C-terminal domain-containing protein n=1 Tax=Gymnopilus dilepis TaxID=231916 RepID=A0A409Y8J5_9AGAR|nr:hypothetical protein CVT26_014126 [Gymnopilus dilepis]